MNFGDSSPQTMKIKDWIWSFGPDMAPFSGNRINISEYSLTVSSMVPDLVWLSKTFDEFHKFHHSKTCAIWH